MAHRQVVEQNVMKKFFRNHLSLFPEAKELLELKIFQHEPGLILDSTVILAKYELTFKKTDGTTYVEIIRGSADAGEKRLKSYHILKSLWSNGFNDGLFVIPEPLGYFPECRLLLYKNVGGESLMQKFEQGRNDYFQNIERAVDWLVKFHQLKIKSVPETEYDWQKEKRGLTHLIESLVKKYSSQEDRIKDLEKTILKLEKKSLSEDNFSLIHGDFQPNNIIINKEKTAVIDFNDAFFYDELFDLTYFLTQVEFMLKRMQNLDISEFLEKEKMRYFAARNFAYDSASKKKIHLFRARTLLQIKTLVTHEEGEKILTEIETHAQKAI